MVSKPRIEQLTKTSVKVIYKYIIKYNYEITLTNNRWISNHTSNNGACYWHELVSYDGYSEWREL